MSDAREAGNSWRSGATSSALIQHRSHITLYFLPALLLTLSACATASRHISVTPREAADLHNWQVSGRIAVSGAHEGGSGSFTWLQKGADADVHMRGPIGIGNLHLKISDDALSIETGDGQHYDADAAKTELAERLGAEVPARDLRYWLIGAAAPGAHEWATRDDGTATLTQHDWRIEYRFGADSGVKLPTRLLAVSGRAKVRIVIDRWIAIG